MNTLEEKKGEKILLIDISKISTFTDFFIICNGTSERMLTSLANAVHDVVKKEAGLSPRIEGKKNGGWLVLDLGDVVVHFFSPDQREYYDLEGLWSEGKTLLRLD